MSCRRGCCPDDLTHYRSIRISATVTPTRSSSVKAAQTQAIADSWDRDIPAYKAAVREGLQPERVDGCAELMARAETREEIEGGP